MNQKDSVAIVVGIEKYRRDLPAATHAENDATVFARYAERTLGIPRKNVKLLVGADAAKSDIEAALQEWLPLQKASRVYFFFSGHGAPDPTTGDSYLVPWDGDPAFLKTKGLRLSHVYKSLEEGANDALVFVDSCFSGAGERTVLAAGTRPLVAVKNLEAPVKGRLAVFAAAMSTETSGASPDSNHGLFTHHLLRGMGGAADRDGDGAISLVELDVFLRRNVAQDARRANRSQTPKLSTSSSVLPGEVMVVDGLVED